MPHKTIKSFAKRFKIKKGRSGVKVMKRTDGQDHFNARESGNTRRNKRSDSAMSLTVQKTILRSMPFSK